VRLDQLTPAHVRRAVSVYMRHAWPHPERANPWFDPARLEGISRIEGVFEEFNCKSEERDGPKCQSYSLRLGNESYPFMKFVLQEYLVDQEYFFSVDTHDELDIHPGSADYAAWIVLRERNLALKKKIEAEWSAAGLPTNEELCELAQGIARVEACGTQRGRLLVVDDERGVAQGLEALLSARGYNVECAYDGQEVLDRLSQDPLPDLVLLDYSMPELDGEEVLQCMRSCDRLAAVPVLLVTASSIDMSRMQRVSGLLRKPYPRQLLFTMLEQLLRETPTDLASDEGK
jgi:CheY-like chemotaxis protein